MQQNIIKEFLFSFTYKENKSKSTVDRIVDFRKCRLILDFSIYIQYYILYLGCIDWGDNDHIPKWYEWEDEKGNVSIHKEDDVIDVEDD